jgi:RNA polymerase sigma factor (sigma-70 family)
MTVIEDMQLVRQLKKGSTQALRRIYDKYRDQLLKISMVLTGDRTLSEDVVQDVFTRLIQSSDRLNAYGNFRNYLITCVINRVRTLRRDSKRHQAAEYIPQDSSCCTENGPEYWLILNEQVQQLSEAMMQLPWEQREVIILRFETGKGFHRIAAIQKVSVNTVRSRYRYGMEKLRALLNKEKIQ